MLPILLLKSAIALATPLPFNNSEFSEIWSELQPTLTEVLEICSQNDDCLVYLNQRPVPTRNGNIFRFKGSGDLSLLQQSAFLTKLSSRTTPISEKLAVVERLSRDTSLSDQVYVALMLWLYDSTDHRLRTASLSQVPRAYRQINHEYHGLLEKMLRAGINDSHPEVQASALRSSAGQRIEIELINVVSNEYSIQSLPAVLQSPYFRAIRALSRENPQQFSHIYNDLLETLQHSAISPDAMVVLLAILNQNNTAASTIRLQEVVKKLGLQNSVNPRVAAKAKSILQQLP